MSEMIAWISKEKYKDNAAGETLPHLGAIYDYIENIYMNNSNNITDKPMQKLQRMICFLFM